MGRRLISDDVRDQSTVQEFREHLGGVACEADGEWLAAAEHFPAPIQGLLQGARLSITVARADASLDTALIHLNHDDDAAVHGHGQRLSAAHASHAAREYQPARQCAPEVLLG